MNEAQAKTWMRRLASDTPALELPAFDRIEALARLEEAFEARQRAAASLDWIDAVWQSLALTAVAAVAIWLGDVLS